MHKQIQFTSIAGALLAAGLFVTTTPAPATIINTSNVAVYASGTFRDAGGGTSSTTLLNDQSPDNQLDAGNSTAGDWVALTWPNNPQDLSRVIMGFVNGGGQFMPSSFDVQKAIVANPSGSVDANWQTIQSYSGLGGANPANSFAFSPGISSTGLRIVRTGPTDFVSDDKIRIDEIWAFSHYNNLALTATATAPGWAAAGANLKDEMPNTQDYGALATAPTNTFTWASPQTIGGMLLVSGLGSFPSAFSVQAWDGSSWLTVTNVTGLTSTWSVSGNQGLTDTFEFPGRVTTTSLRLFYTAAGGNINDGLIRVGEVFLFEAVPEPSTVMLFGLGGLVLVWKRRQAAK